MKGLQVSQYTLETKLGEGGMAEVWRGYDAARNTYAAVKFLSAQWADNREIAERFVLETGRQTKLRHPHIVSAFDFVYVEGHPYLLMPYIEGESLDRILSRMQGTVPLEKAISISGDVLGALQYAHSQNIVHRDVKPSNIMLDREGRAYVLDFGIALGQGEQRLTQMGTAVGTPRYMSPEQIMAAPNIDGRSDIYSFGCILYQMLTHAYVFDADQGSGEVSFPVNKKHLSEAPRPPRERNPSIPEHVDAAILRCLEKDPAQRFDSCSNLLAALNDPAWMNPQPAVAPAIPPAIPRPVPAPFPSPPHAATVAMPAAPAPPNRLLAISAGVLLGTLLIAGGFVARQILTSRQTIEIPRPARPSASVTPVPLPSELPPHAGEATQPPAIKPSPMPPVSRPADPAVPVSHPQELPRQQAPPAPPHNSGPVVPPASPGKPAPVPGRSARQRSGVLVWSGQLTRDQVVEIIGLHASIGTVSGNPLPGVPVQLTLRTDTIMVTGPPNSVNRYSQLRFRSAISGPATVAIQWTAVP